MLLLFLVPLLWLSNRYKGIYLTKALHQEGFRWEKGNLGEHMSASPCFPSWLMMIEIEETQYGSTWTSGVITQFHFRVSSLPNFLLENSKMKLCYDIIYRDPYCDTCIAKFTCVLHPPLSCLILGLLGPIHLTFNVSHKSKILWVFS